MTGRATREDGAAVQVGSGHVIARRAPVRVAHFIITRFCVRGGRWLDHVDGLWFKDVNPLRPRNVDLRLKLLETTCLPGLLSQTNRDFTWVLVVDANLDRRAKQRLEALARRAESVLYDRRGVRDAALRARALRSRASSPPSNR